MDQGIVKGYDWDHVMELSKQPFEVDENKHETHGEFHIPKNAKECFVLFHFTNVWNLAMVDNTLIEHEQEANNQFGWRMTGQCYELGNFQAFLKMPNKDHDISLILSAVQMIETRRNMRMSTVYEVKKEERMIFSQYNPSRWVLVKLIRGIDF